MWLSRYFALLPVAARVLGLAGEEVKGVRLGPESLVTVGWAVLPMGLSWSLCFAQVANAELAARVLGVSREAGLRDDGPPMGIRGPPARLVEHFA